MISLVEAIGEVAEEHDGKVKLTIGPESAVEDSRERNYGDNRWGDPE